MFLQLTLILGRQLPVYAEVGLKDGDPLSGKSALPNFPASPFFEKAEHRRGASLRKSEKANIKVVSAGMRC